MARKKLIFNENEEQQQDVKHEPVNFSADREPVEADPECSSPSASGFMVMPTVNPKKKKINSSKKFSDEDEIALLKGLADFWANGKNKKWAEFHEFVKNDLKNQFSKSQVYEKARKLRIKFEKARDGGGVDFSDSHEANLFRLSKAIWGDENAENDAVEGNEGNKMERKRKEVDVGVNRKKKKGKEKYQSGDEKCKSLEQENKVNEKGKEKYQSGDEKCELEQGKEVDEKGKEKYQSGDEKCKLLEQENEKGKEKYQSSGEKCEKLEHEVYDHDEENNWGKRRGDFEREFPLLCESFQSLPIIVRENWTMIPREKAQELEERYRELKEETLRWELKRIELIKRDIHHQLQKD